MKVTESLPKMRDECKALVTQLNAAGRFDDAHDIQRLLMQIEDTNKRLLGRKPVEPVPG